MTTLGNITKAPPRKCYVVLGTIMGQRYMRSVRDTWTLDPRDAMRFDKAHEAKTAAENTRGADGWTTLKDARTRLFHTPKG